MDSKKTDSQTQELKSIITLKDKILNTVFDNLPSAVVVYNADGNIIYGNKVATTILGLTKDELLSINTKTQWNFISEEGKKLFIEDYPITKVITTLQPLHDYTLGLIQPNKNFTTWVKINALPEFNDRGGLEIIIVYFIDITFEKYVKNKLLDQNNKLAIAKIKADESRANVTAIIENTNDSIWAIDTKYQIIYINNVFKTEFQLAFGVQLEKGMNLVQSIPIHLRQFWKDKYDSVLSNQHFVFENKVEVSPDLYIYIEVSMNPILLEGIVVGASFFGRNITNNKQIELSLYESKKLLNLTERLAKIGGWEYDVLTNKPTYTEGIYEIYGTRFFKPEDGILFYHPDDRPMLWQAFNDSITQNKAYDLELRFINHKGEDLWVRTIGEPIVKEGKVIKIVGFVTDITDRKRTELALVESNTTKDKFFSIIAHDIKSPISSMLSFSELLYDNFDEYTPQKQKKFIGLIKDSIENTYNLLENLLLWSLSKKGMINFVPEEVNLNLLVKETINILKQSLENKRITIKYQIFESDKIYADRNMILTILRNLITNAIKFTPEGGQISILESVMTKGKENFIKITIKDTGIGISKEKQLTLFDIGENNSTLGTNNEKGTGLGLILCYEFVKKHGGEIWVESEEGKGSEFNFTLPLVIVSIC